MLRTILHYLYYCYFILIHKQSSNREDGASSLISMLGLSVFITIYYTGNILFERQTYIASVEGLGVFFVGSLIWYSSRFYFVKKQKYKEIKLEFQQIPIFISIIIGVFFLIFPFVLFVYTGIKMGEFIRSIQ